MDIAATKNSMRCPACDLALASLDKLDLHLTFSCSSRSSAAKTSPPRTTKRPRSADLNVIPLDEHKVNTSGRLPFSKTGNDPTEHRLASSTQLDPTRAARG